MFIVVAFYCSTFGVECFFLLFPGGGGGGFEYFVLVVLVVVAVLIRLPDFVCLHNFLFLLNYSQLSPFLQFHEFVFIFCHASGKHTTLLLPKIIGNHLSWSTVT